MQEIDKFDRKLNVIPNRIEKYTVFTINKSSSLDELVKNLPDNDFKYLF